MLVSVLIKSTSSLSTFVISYGFGHGRAGVLKRTMNEQRLMGLRPSDEWIKIGVGVLLHDQT